jgi:hypothetical protein
MRYDFIFNHCCNLALPQIANAEDLSSGKRGRHMNCLFRKNEYYQNMLKKLVFLVKILTRIT